MGHQQQNLIELVFLFFVRFSNLCLLGILCCFMEIPGACFLLDVTTFPFSVFPNFLSQFPGTACNVTSFTTDSACRNSYIWSTRNVAPLIFRKSSSPCGCSSTIFRIPIVLNPPTFSENSPSLFLCFACMPMFPSNARTCTIHRASWHFHLHSFRNHAKFLTLTIVRIFMFFQVPIPNNAMFFIIHYFFVTIFINGFPNFAFKNCLSCIWICLFLSGAKVQLILRMFIFISLVRIDAFFTSDASGNTILSILKLLEHCFSCHFFLQINSHSILQTISSC